jgi:hypothetical protein
MQAVTHIPQLMHASERTMRGRIRGLARDGHFVLFTE